MTDEEIEAKVSEALASLTLEDKARLTAGAATFATHALPEIGLSAVNMADGPMGVASTRVDERDTSALTPCGLALAASWDADLVRRIGALVADEARKRDVQVMLAPNLGLSRSPNAGRAFETFSEDPFLAGEMGAAWVEGLQSRGVGACVKHLAGNDSETDRDRMNSVIDERALREVYLAPFERALAAGAWGVLMAYNRVNGVHCVEHRQLIEQIVKGDWDFDGFVVSDWFGTFDTLASAEAGLDLEMPGPPRVFGPAVAEAVRAGKVSTERLDDAARRMLRLAARADGLGEASAAALPPAEDQAELLREAAAAGFVLLRNEGKILPLSPERGQRIAVIGPNAAEPCYQGGTFAKIGLRASALTPLAAIRATLSPTFEIDHAVGVQPEYRLPPLAAHPVRASGDGDRGMTVEYFAGHGCEGEPLAAETRNTNSLTWFGAVPGAGSIDKPISVRARGLLTPEAGGRHTLYAGGTGSVRVAVDGREIFRRDAQIEPKDVMGRLKSGMADAIPIDLIAGQPVELAVELDASPARAHGLWWGHAPPGDAATLLNEAVEAAGAADQVVLVVGETADAGVESIDRRDTHLPTAQIELIRRVAEANPNTVVIVNAAHAVDLGWADQVAAVMIAWYPGEEFGAALAEVLTGAREPGGRLPVTFARDEVDYPAFGLKPDADGDLAFSEGVLIGYRSLAARGAAPRYGLGHGLCYGEVAFEQPIAITGADGQVSLRINARNTGDRPTKFVLQAYVTDQGDQPAFPRLAGFAAVQLQPGEAQSVVIDLPERALQVWSPERGAWVRGVGPHEIRAGTSLETAVLCGLAGLNGSGD